MSKNQAKDLNEIEELTLVSEDAVSEKPKTKEEKELELLEAEYHKLSLIALVLEQRYKIKQLQSALNQFEQPIKAEQKVKRTETDY